MISIMKTKDFLLFAFLILFCLYVGIIGIYKEVYQITLTFFALAFFFALVLKMETSNK